MKRKRLPLRWARKLLEKQGGKCAVKGCETVLIIGPRGQHVNWIDEHILALGRGGTNALKNRELRCVPHARDKTNRPKSGGIGGDIFEIRKTGRMRSKLKVRKRPARQRRAAATTTWPKGRKLQSRGFQKRQK